MVDCCIWGGFPCPEAAFWVCPFLGEKETLRESSLYATAVQRIRNALCWAMGGKKKETQKGNLSKEIKKCLNFCRKSVKYILLRPET